MGCDKVEVDPESTAASVILQAMTPVYIGLARHLPIPKCIFLPTNTPTARSEGDFLDLQMQGMTALAPTGRSTTSSPLPLTAIPLGVADFLLQTYLKMIIPQHPIYLIQDVVDAFHAAFYRTAINRNLATEPSYRDTYIVSLIMAISLSTSARHKQAHAQSLATGLFQTAMQHAPKMWTNDLPGLQALILSIQYVFLNPSVANLTILSGFVSEAYIDMGLHKELPLNSNIDAQERDLRLRVFWCAREMEIAVAACIRRPPRIPNERITVALPQSLSDFTALPNDTNTLMAHRIWTYRRIESDVMTTLFQSHTMVEDSVPLERWITSIENRVQDWKQDINLGADLNHDESKKALWDELCSFSLIGYHYILVCLYGPCPRLPTRTRPDLLKAFSAAIHVISGYHDQANSEVGHIKYLFHSCYHTFTSATVFLHVLQACKDEIFNFHSLTEIANLLDRFATVFSMMAECWPAASQCLLEFEQLLKPIKDEYTIFCFERTSEDAFNPQIRNGWEAVGVGVGADPDERVLYGDFYQVPYDWNVAFGFDIDP